LPLTRRRLLRAHNAFLAEQERRLDVLERIAFCFRANPLGPAGADGKSTDAMPEIIRIRRKAERALEHQGLDPADALTDPAEAAFLAGAVESPLASLLRIQHATADDLAWYRHAVVGSAGSAAAATAIQTSLPGEHTLLNALRISLPRSGYTALRNRSSAGSRPYSLHDDDEDRRPADSILAVASARVHWDPRRSVRV
jgi:hypothetical protein